MKKTLIIATAAGLALSSETQDNELFMNSIKNGYYTVSNAILSRPAMIAGGMQMVQNGMARPTFLNHFDETADDEFMAKGHGQGHEGKKNKKNKDGKKNRPQPAQEAQPVEQVQDNALFAEDDEFGQFNAGVNAGNNGFGANAGVQGNIGRNGNWNVGGQIQTQPGGRPNWGVNAGMTIKFDEEDNELFVEDFQDDELGQFNMGVNGGNNGFGANAGVQGNIGRNGNWNVGGQIQTQPGGRPNWGVNAGMTIKFDEEDNELMAKGHGQGHEGKKNKKNKDGKKNRPQPAQEAQPVEQVQDNALFAEEDDELFMQSIKNGYYTVSNAILSRPAMIAGGMQMVQNGMARPTFLNHFDEVADDELGQFNAGINAGNRGIGANAGVSGNIGRNGNWNVGGQINKAPGSRPSWGVGAGMTFRFDEEDNELFVEDFQDDELGQFNAGVNAGNRGIGANAGVSGNIGRNGNWNVGGQINKAPGSRPSWGVGAGMSFKFDDEDNELFVEDFQDDELGQFNMGVNGGNNGFGANAGVQGNIGRNGNWNVGGQIQTQPGGRPNWGVNAGMTIKFDENADDEFAATEKTEKPRRKRQPLERPEGAIQRNHKFRVPKEVAADNTLFDLAELLEDN